MPNRVLENFVKANLSREEAERLYGLGREAVIWALLEFAARLKGAQESSPDISTPSGQIPVYKKPNNEKRRHKKLGAKEGHPGARRETPQRIDEEKEHSLEKCPCCGEALGAAFEERTRITEDIPEVKSIITKHIIKRYRCKHCGETVEAKVTEALPRAAVGNNIVALTAWMHYGLGTTLSQIIAVLSSHLSFKISGGGLVKMWRRLAMILDQWYEEICVETRSKVVLHADETGWRVNGKTHWLWCFTGDDVTCYFINHNRGSPALFEFMGETFSGCLITDFWPAYDRIACESRQYCLAHLFRELEKVDKKNSSAEWARFRKKLSRILKDAIRFKSKDGISDETWESRYARLPDRLGSLCRENWNDSDVRRLCARLEKRADGLFTFLLNENVHHTNNRAEREIRPAVIMRKVIQQNRNNRSAHTQEVLMTVFRTLKLRGHDPVKTVVSALSIYLETGKLPPLPEKVHSDG